MYIHSLHMQSYVASFPDLPAHPQTLYVRLIFYPLKADKKIIACIMFAGEREGLGTRLVLRVYVIHCMVFVIHILFQKIMSN